MRTCDDVNECSTKSPCDQNCKNTPGSFQCSCNNGYTLSANNIKCLPKPCSKLNTGICPPNSYQDSVGVVCKNINTDCNNNMLLNSVCKFKCPSGYAPAKISAIAHRNYFAEFINESDFTTISPNASCLLNGMNLEWSVNSSNYFCRRTNDPPRNLQLSKTSVKELEPSDTLVGTFTSFDENQVKYSIETIIKGSNLFYVSGQKLLTSKTMKLRDILFDKINITIRATDATSPDYYTIKTFLIDILNVNEAPEDIEISEHSFNDLTMVEDVIGNLTAIDYDTKPFQRSGTFLWTLVTNPGNHFKIVNGNSLALNTKFSDNNKDFSTEIEVQCSDNNPTDPKSHTQKITLFHKNANNPVELSAWNIKPIPESTLVNVVVGQIRVIDSEGDNITINDLSSEETIAKFQFQNRLCNLTNGTMHCSSDIGIFMIVLFIITYIPTHLPVCLHVCLHL